MKKLAGQVLFLIFTDLLMTGLIEDRFSCVLLHLIYCSRFLWLKYVKRKLASCRHKVANRRRILMSFLIIMSIL